MNTIIKTGVIGLTAAVLGGCSFLFPPERLPTIDAVDTMNDGKDMAVVAVAGPTEKMEDMAVEEMMSDTLADGETLWSFAARTTGSGFNWGKIAEMNGISEDDVTKLQAGTELKVPMSMSK